MSKRVSPRSKSVEEDAAWIDTVADPRKAAMYDKYIRQHERRLRQLERELRGDIVPGDFDGGYDE